MFGAKNWDLVVFSAYMCNVGLFVLFNGGNLPHNLGYSKIFLSHEAVSIICVKLLFVIAEVAEGDLRKTHVFKCQT